MLSKQTRSGLMARLSALWADVYGRRLQRFFPQKANRIYILPNRDGMVYLILLSFILLMAILEHVNLTYFVLAVAAGLFFAGLVFTNYNLSGIDVRAIGCRSAFVGEPARMVLQLTNSSRRTRYNIAVELPLDDHPAGFVDKTLFQLRPAEPSMIEIAVPLSQRGRYEIGRIRLSTTFPFGLFRSWCWWTIGMTYFAYPRPKGELRLPLAGVADSVDVSSNDSGKESCGADFSGHKVYEFGDSLRHVNWRLVARGYAPHVKQFRGSHFQMVGIDFDRLGGIPDLEQRLCQVSKWIKVCRQNNLPFQVKLSNKEIYSYTTPDDDPRACLERLAVWKKTASR